MEKTEIIIKVLIWLLGMAASVGFYKLAMNQIKTRAEKIPSLAKAYSPDLLKSKASFVIWEITYALLLVLALVFASNWIRLILALIFLICGMNIAAVDLAVRRIPNELLITVMIAALVCDLSEYFLKLTERSFKEIALSMIVGLVGSFLIFLIPKKIGIYIGNGDIKLSAVIGFTVGLIGYIQAMLLMAIFMLIYLIVLLITKKGGLKTKTPMGPALSLGGFLTIVFPVLTGMIQIW